MSAEVLKRASLSTSIQFAEISPSQPAKEVYLDPHIGSNSELRGTGFNLPKEMGRLIAHYNQGLHEGKDSIEALTASVSELEVNIRTFIVEYIQTKTILPHVSRLQEVEGKVRMVGKNGVSVLSGITAEERAGATLEGSKRAESFLTFDGLQKTTCRVAVINSPLGHSGLISEKGTAIKYKSNQTMVCWTDEAGELHGLTIVSDLNKDQSRQLSIDLGVDEAYLNGGTEAEQVANIVGNPGLFSYGKEISNPAKYVLGKIIAIRGNADFRLEQEHGEDPEYRSVAETQEDIEKFESLLKFKPLWEKCIRNLKKEVLSKGGNLDNVFIQSQIARAIEETILEITVDYLEKTQPHKFKVPTDNVIYFQSFSSDSQYGQSGIKGVFVKQNPMAKFAVAAAFLRTRSGCAGGGGGGSRATLRGSGSGSSEESSTSSIEGSDGTCKDCNQSNLDNHYHCPDCGLKYADETNTERTSVCACGFEFGCGGSANTEEQEEDSKGIDFPTTASSLPLASTKSQKAA